MDDQELRVLRGQEITSAPPAAFDLFEAGVKLFRLMGAGLGLICVIIGFVFGVQIFGLARELVNSPQKLEGHFKVWGGLEAASAKPATDMIPRPNADAIPEAAAPAPALSEGATTATLMLAPKPEPHPAPRDPVEGALEILRQIVGDLAGTNWGRPLAAIFLLAFLGVGVRLSFGFIAAGGRLLGLAHREDAQERKNTRGIVL